MTMEQDGFINRPMSIALDAVRGSAALVVLLGHAVQQRIYTGPWPFTTMMQHNAVIVFFVLSGLVIANSAMKRHGTLPDYALSRAARILPVSIFTLVFGAAVFAMGLALGLPQFELEAPLAEASLHAFILPLLFLSESALGAGLAWNPPYWSLVYEVWFYAFFGAAIYLRGGGRLLALGIVALLAGIKVVLMLPVWLIGVALAFRAPIRPVGEGQAVALVITGLALVPISNGLALDTADWLRAISGLTVDQVRYSSFALTDFMFGIGMALFFLALRPLADRRAALLERMHRPIRWLAECSFTLYLLHWPILDLMRGAEISAGANVPVFVILLAGIVAFSGLVAKLTEHRRTEVRKLLEKALVRRRVEAGALPGQT